MDATSNTQFIQIQHLSIMKGYAFLVVSAYCLAMSETAPSCPYIAILECTKPIMVAMYTMDMQNPDMQAMCSLYETYFSCMEPYKDSLSSCPAELSSGYGAATSQWDSYMSAMCSGNQGPTNQDNVQ